MTLPEITPQPEGVPAQGVMPPRTSLPAHKPRSLWCLPDFVKFWTGQSVSKLGDNFALLALPLLLLQLTGNPLTLGFAEAAYYVPYLVLGLPAGALVDHLPRRRVMILCDVTRMLTFSFMAALLVAGILRRDTVWVIYALQALNGVVTIFFDVSYLAATPNIVSPDQLLAANSALQVSDSTSQLAGPPLAGAVFQAFGATFALVADAISFIISFISLALIPHEFRRAAGAVGDEILNWGEKTQMVGQRAGQDQAPTTATRRQTGMSAPSDVQIPVSPPVISRMMRDIREGLGFAWGQPVLRWTILLISMSNFFSNATYPLILFHMRNQLHFSGGLVGVVLGCMAAGGIAGSVVAGRLGRRFGMLPVALCAELIIGLSPLTFVATGQAWIFAAVLFIAGIAGVAINVNILTLRQSITPDHMMSR